MVFPSQKSFEYDARAWEGRQKREEEAESNQPPKGQRESNVPPILSPPRSAGESRLSANSLGGVNMKRRWPDDPRVFVSDFEVTASL
jgi:hypothetical protein